MENAKIEIIDIISYCLVMNGNIGVSFHSHININIEYLQLVTATAVIMLRVLILSFINFRCSIHFDSITDEYTQIMFRCRFFPSNYDLMFSLSSSLNKYRSDEYEKLFHGMSTEEEIANDCLLILTEMGSTSSRNSKDLNT